MNLAQFRKTHRLVTKARFAKIEEAPVDLEFYPDVIRIHAHDFDFGDNVIAQYHILEMPDGFHFWFSHPCDEIAPSLAEAQRLQFEAIVE